MLTVIIDAGDMVDEQFVEQIGPGKDDGHCWEWPEGSQGAVGIHGTIAALHTRVGDVEDQMGEMRACVLGDFDVPKISLISILQDFENRLRAIKQENDALRAAAGPVPNREAKARGRKK
jgi:hypothetical protein